MTHEIRIEAPIGYPLFGWTRESIKAHILQNPLSAGDRMIIYNAHAGFHRYSLATVVNPASGPQKRVILSKAGDSGGNSFHRSGVNSFMPKGRTVMIPPVPALMDYLAIDCDVILEIGLYARGTRAEM